MRKYIAIVGSTGQIGRYLTENLLAAGHRVRMIARKRDASTNKMVTDFESKGADFLLVEDTANPDKMFEAMKGCDTFVAAVPGSQDIILKLEPIWLEAAKKAGIKRFVPTEFGAHTRNIDYGDGIIFDHKKDFHKKLFNSGLDWTLIYNGIIHDYALPNMRFFNEITTFGNLDIPIYTHVIEDIGRHAALAITDDRTRNKCVQMDYQCISQKQMVQFVKKYWSCEPLVYKYYSTKYIQLQKENAGDQISAKAGAETDKERWGINNVVYVLGKLHAFTDETVRSSTLWPDFVSKTPEDSIKDPRFFLERA